MAPLVDAPDYGERIRKIAILVKRQIGSSSTDHCIQQRESLDYEGRKHFATYIGQNKMAPWATAPHSTLDCVHVVQDNECYRELVRTLSSGI